MNILLFGATGMVGQGVLRECLLAPDVAKVLTVGRTATGQQHPKLRELVHRDLSDYSAIERELTGFDACFFCLVVPSAGMSEDAYRKVNYDITLGAARTLVRLNPQISFIYVTGKGPDSTGRGPVMWARVKGGTGNTFLERPFRNAYTFRPGAIQLLHGIQSKTRSYRILYALVSPVTLVMRRVFPSSITTTELIGRAMLNIARQGYPKHFLQNADINDAAVL